MNKKILALSVLLLGSLTFVFKDNISETFNLVFPKNKIEAGATSTAHTIDISENVYLSRTSAKSDIITITNPKTGQGKYIVRGYFDRLNFNSHKAVFEDINSHQFIVVDLNTLEYIRLTQSEFNSKKIVLIGNTSLKKHYNFPWSTGSKINNVSVNE